MLWLRTWYRLLTQQHLLGVGGESRNHGWMPTRWLQSSGCPWVGDRQERCCSDWFGFLWVAGRGSEAALSCHPSAAFLLLPLLPGSCSTIKVSIAHLKCEMRAQWEEVACSFVPWCMKSPNKMQMDWRRPCGLVATTGSEECEPNSWQDRRCGFAVKERSLLMRRGAVFHGPPFWPVVCPPLLEGAAGQACYKRWTKVCVPGELEESWGCVSPSCLVTADPCSAASGQAIGNEPWWIWKVLHCLS